MSKTDSSEIIIELHHTFVRIIVLNRFIFQSERALSFTPAPSLKNISIILKNKLEKAKDEKVLYSKGSQYGITRGSAYYGGER